ncbi:MAG: SAM-dependent methyltransferase, partial [Gammaproteobacteria bacterium]
MKPPVIGRPPLWSLALVSAAALGYQILLLRLFSIIQWHHFAYMIISLALLGYGASGTVLSLLGDRLQRRLPQLYVVAILLFSISGLPAFLTAQQLAFSPEELLWRPVLIWRLIALYLVLGAPFFFVACAVGVVLMCWGTQAGRVYAADLAGAALGSVAAVGSLWLIEPLTGLSLMAAAGLIAAFLAARELRWGTTLTVAASALWLSILGVSPAPEVRLSPYKDLASAQQVSGAKIETVRSSPYGVVTVLSNMEVPFRNAPGIGLLAETEPPEQKAVFVDGNQAAAITRDTGVPGKLGFLHALPAAAPYALSEPERVLVLSAGGGMLALQARLMGAIEIKAVESNPDVLRLILGGYAEFSGNLYGGSPARGVRADPRAFVIGDPGGWNLIQLPASGGLGGGAAGLFALSEDYLRTRESFGLLLQRLAPNGILAAHAWVALPPRGSLRLAATIVAALRDRGNADPGRSILALRSWQMVTVLAKNGQFERGEIEALKVFAHQYGFDLAWYPGMQRDEANRIHRMPLPWVHDTISAFAAGRGDAFAADYKFDIDPATDDRPFFHNFLRWSTVPEILGLLRNGGMALLEAGYVLLLATLIQAIVLGFLLVVAPLAASNARVSMVASPRLSLKTVVYFGAIGLAFMLVELAAIHRFILFLEEPIFSSAIVVSSFLVFAGLGSLCG